MNRTWPRAQITEREEERPWQQRAVAQLSPSSPPLLLGGFWFFFFFLLSVACCCWELWLGLLKLISMQKEVEDSCFSRLALLWAVLVREPVYRPLCAVLDGAGMWFIMWRSGELNRHNHSQPHQAIWDHAGLFGWLLSTHSITLNTQGRQQKWRVKRTHGGKGWRVHELMLVDVCVCTNCIHADMFVCGVHVFDF